MAKNALSRIKSADKLRETALSERKKNSQLRVALRDAQTELQSVDWLGEAMAAGVTLAGAGTSGALRAFGLTEGREHLEPVAALAIGFAAHRMDQPNGISFATGLASRWASEFAEDRIVQVRAAIQRDKTATPAAEKVASPIPAVEAA